MPRTFPRPAGDIPIHDEVDVPVGGRCISVTHRALGSTRVMPQCAALGEAAGAAAALSIAGNCAPR